MAGIAIVELVSGIHIVAGRKNRWGVALTPLIILVILSSNMVGCDYMASQPDWTFSWVFFVFSVVDNMVIVVVEVDSIVVVVVKVFVGNVVVVVVELVLWMVVVVVGMKLRQPLADIGHGVSRLLLRLLW